MQNTILVVIFSGNVWDPKRKAHVTLAATVRYPTNHKRSATLVCVQRGSWTVCDRTLLQTVIVGKRVRWSLAWQMGYAENSCAIGHKSHTVHTLARVPYIIFPKRFITTHRLVSLRHYKSLITGPTRAKEFSVCCIAHDYILQGLWIIAPYPRRFLGRVGRTPYRPHSLGDGSRCRRGKGLKTIF